MNAGVVLGVIALSQAVFLGVVVVLLFANRARARRRVAREMVVTSRIANPLHEWLVGQGSLEAVVATLRDIPVELALEQASLIATLRIPPSQHLELARALRGERWVARALAGARSRFWWRRLEAARMLTVVGTGDDHELLERLLTDENPAVQTVATACLARVGDASLVRLVVEQLPERPVVVRLYQFGALRETWRLTTPVLLEVLRRDVPARRLETWINLAGAIASPECLAEILPLHLHADADVRLAVGKALRQYYHPDALPALRHLLDDPDWRVRGQAARGLGALGASDAVPGLARALGDRSWWVRFRAGLALAQLGEPGRDALRAARTMPDRFAREMATMIAGLSEGGVTELAEA